MAPSKEIQKLPCLLGLLPSMELWLGLHSSVCLRYSKPHTLLSRYFPLGVREYAVSPILVSSLQWAQYKRRKRELGLDGSQVDETSPVVPGAPQSFAELRLHKILDTSLAGAIAGGALNSLKRSASCFRTILHALTHSLYMLRRECGLYTRLHNRRPLLHYAPARL